MCLPVLSRDFPFIANWVNQYESIYKTKYIEVRPEQVIRKLVSTINNFNGYIAYDNYVNEVAGNIKRKKQRYPTFYRNFYGIVKENKELYESLITLSLL